MKIVTVVGARPQFIKASSVSRAIEEFNQSAGREAIKEIMVHTGQHYDYKMSRVFFEELDLKEPDYHLSVGSGTHGWQTGEMLKRVEEVLIQEKPDIVLVYGDTNSTLAGALAASKLHIPIAHVEAGLRSFNKKMPEEINRVLTDHISQYLFCPTKTAVENLAREGIKEGVYLVGDVMCDVLLSNLERVKEKSKILETLGLRSRKYLLATIHRAENVDNPYNLKSIIEAFSSLEETIVFPVHPRTQKALSGLDICVNSNICVINPVGYLDMLNLEKNARLILTDSGGVQKEAYILGVPCLTLREETEWIETVEAGWNSLVGVGPDKIKESVKTFCPNGYRFHLFGDGRSCERIIQILVAVEN
jgi:UDP-N-acetylglucosamine 2-epimerase (non-hydrolysing)